jgi:hypothetical protein
MYQPEVYRWSDVALDIAKENGWNNAKEEAALLDDTKKAEAALPDAAKKEETEVPEDAKAAAGKDSEKRSESDLKKQHLYVGERTLALLETELSSVIFSAILRGDLLARYSNGLPMKSHPAHGYSPVGTNAPYLYPEDVNAFFKNKGYSYGWNPKATKRKVSSGENLWEAEDSRDPPPEYTWYTPARYFARQHVKQTPMLARKKLKLAEEVSRSLAAVGIYKRGKSKKPFNANTILKSLSNVLLN